MSLSPVANLLPVINDTSDTSGKFTTHVVDTRGKFAAGVVVTGGKFATGVVLTVVHLDLQISLQIFLK